MGISVQSSGIKVGEGKYYLVNINADPALNGLLVYYLKVRLLISLGVKCVKIMVTSLQESRTLIGRPGAEVEQDIQLSGLGIQQQHATIDIENSEVFVTPLPNARFQTIPTLPVSFLLCFLQHQHNSVHVRIFLP